MDFNFYDKNYHSTVFASSLTGVMATLLAGIGIFIGGALVSKFQLTVSQCVLMLLASDLVFIFCMIISLMVYCDPTDYHTYSQRCGKDPTLYNDTF